MRFKRFHRGHPRRKTFWLFTLGAHITVTPENGPRATWENSSSFWTRKDVDGFIATATGQTAGNSELAETLDGVRAMIRLRPAGENFFEIAGIRPTLKQFQSPFRGKLSAGSENACEEGD